MRVRVTLGARIAATVAVAVLGSTVAVTYAAYELERTGTENRFIAAAQTGAAADVQQAANAIERQPKVSAVTSVADFVQQRGGIEWLVIDTNNPDNSQGDGVEISNVPPPLMEIAFNGGFGQAWTSVNGTRKLAIGGRVGESAVALVEYYDFGPVQAQLGRLRSDLIKVDVIGLLVALILGVAVAAGISRPVRLTAAAARQLGGGALDTRVPVHGNSELGDLAVSFNDMAARLSDAMHALQLAQTQQRQFVADVSHELRTPLAAMLAAAEGLGQRGPGRPAALGRARRRADPTDGFTGGEPLGDIALRRRPGPAGPRTARHGCTGPGRGSDGGARRRRPADDDRRSHRAGRCSSAAYDPAKPRRQCGPARRPTRPDPRRRPGRAWSA